MRQFINHKILALTITWTLSWAYQMSSVTQNEICDEIIEKQLREQNIEYKCNLTDSLISVDGKGKNQTMSLIFQNQTFYLQKIEIFNFSHIIFSSLNFERTNFINNLQLLKIHNNTFVQIDEFKYIIYNEIFFYQIHIEQNENAAINNVEIIFPNGYTSKIQSDPFGILILQNNKNSSLINYNFYYRQCDEDQIQFLSMKALAINLTNITVQTVNIEIDFTKYKLKNITLLDMQPLFVSNCTIQINELNIKLNSLSNIYSFNQKLPLVTFIFNLLIYLRSVNIQNNNSFIDIIGFRQTKQLQFYEIQLQNILLLKTPSIGSVQQIKSVMEFDANSFVRLNIVNIKNCNVDQQYLALYFNKDSQLVQAFEINYANSSWTDTMINIDPNSDLKNQFGVYLNIIDSNFYGFNSFINVNLMSSTIYFYLNFTSKDEISLENGLIQVYGGNLFIINSIINIKNQTNINLGKGGIFQMINNQEVVIKNSKITSENQKIANAQFGGIFQILNAYYVEMNNITTFGFKINGQGSLAFMKVSYFFLLNSTIDGFYSQGSGGAIYCSYKGYINMTYSTISNSESGMFGGAVYFYKYNPSISQKDIIIQINIKNNKAQIGGGITYNSYYQKNNEIFNFFNNSATIFGHDISSPVTGVNILRYGEYNPTLTKELQIIPKNFTFKKFSSENLLVLNRTQLKMIYYVVLELNIGQVNITFKDLQCGQQYKCSNNLLSQLCPFPLFDNGDTSNEIFYEYQKLNINNNLLDIEFNEKDDFYLLFQQNNDFNFLKLQFLLQGLSFTIQMQKQEQCELGQIRVNAYGSTYCRYCNNFQASLNPNSTECFKCSSDKYSFCSGNILSLKQGYYNAFKQNNSLQNENQQVLDIHNKKTSQFLRINSRSQYLNQNIDKTNSQNIDQFNDQSIQFVQSKLQNQNQNYDENIFSCSLFPQNCLGGTSLEDNQCAKSHVGPLCQDCDRRNSRGNGTYTRLNSFVCSECMSYSHNLNVFISFCFLLVFIIAFFDFILYLAYSGIIKNKLLKDKVSIGVHVKFLFFFIQIINVCSFYQSPNILKSLFTFQIYIYNPIQNSYFNFFECFLIQIFPHFFSAPYLVLIFETLLPFFMIAIYLGIRFIIVKLILYCKNRKKEDKVEIQSQRMDYFTDKLFVKQLFLYSLYTLSFQVIQVLIAGLFCQSFEGIGSFSSLDLTIECYNEERMYWLIFIIPFLLFYGLMLPGYLLYSLFKNRNNLEQREIKSVFRFLHAELKDEYYLWEFLRYFIKLLIVISIQAIIPNNNMIGIYVIVILGVYTGLLIYFQPYAIDENYYKLQNSQEKFKIGHNIREIVIILSGILIISLYMINATSYSNEYFLQGSSSSKAFALVGNAQAFIVFLMIAANLFKHIIIAIYRFFRPHVNTQSLQSGVIEESQGADNSENMND